jgi:hypothetical protein
MIELAAAEELQAAERPGRDGIFLFIGMCVFFLNGYCVYIYMCVIIYVIYIYIYICFLTFMEISGTSMILYDYMGVFASKDE